MPHRVERLRERLAALRDQLESTAELDSRSYAQLREAVEEMETALRDAEAEDREPNLAESLRERLEEALKRFEGAHPRLTATVGRVIDALSDLGI